MQIASLATEHDFSPRTRARESMQSSLVAGKSESWGISDKDLHMINVLTEDWHIDADDLELKKEIGRGVFGCVAVGNWRHTTVAIKVAHPPQGKPDGCVARASSDVLLGDNNAHLWREVGMMMRVHHPNIVQYLGFSVLMNGGGAQPCIVMEYVDGRTLEAYIRKDLPSAAMHVSQRTKRRLCLEMTLALEYLHGRRPSFITHRDLKPENFLLTRGLQVKLADFGISRLFENSTDPTTTSTEAKAATLPQNLDLTQTADCGTVRFMAPEVFSSATAKDGRKVVTQYSTAADMFSLGLVYYFVFEVGEATHPSSCDVHEISQLPAYVSHVDTAFLLPLSLQRVLPRLGCATPAEHIAALRAGRRPPLSGSTPHPVRALLQACYGSAPCARPSASKTIEVWQALDADARAGCCCSAPWRGRRGNRAVCAILAPAGDRGGPLATMKTSAVLAISMNSGLPSGDVLGGDASSSSPLTLTPPPSTPPPSEAISPSCARSEPAIDDTAHRAILEVSETKAPPQLPALRLPRRAPPVTASASGSDDADDGAPTVSEARSPSPVSASRPSTDGSGGPASPPPVLDVLVSDDGSASRGSPGCVLLYDADGTGWQGRSIPNSLSESELGAPSTLLCCVDSECEPRPKPYEGQRQQPRRARPRSESGASSDWLW